MNLKGRSLHQAMDFLEQGLAAFVVVGSLVHDTVKGGHKLGAIGSNIRRLVLSKNTQEVLESGDRLIDVVLAIIPCFIPAVLRGNVGLQGLQLLVGLGQFFLLSHDLLQKLFRPGKALARLQGRILGTAAARILAQHDVEGSLVLQLQVLHAGTLASQGLLRLSGLPGNLACRVHVEVLAEHVVLGVKFRRSLIVVALFGFGQQLFDQLLLHIFVQAGFIDSLELENGRRACTVHACSRIIRTSRGLENLIIE